MSQDTRRVTNDQRKHSFTVTFTTLMFRLLSQRVFKTTCILLSFSLYRFSAYTFRREVSSNNNNH